MNNCQKIRLVILILLSAGVWAILAFCLKEDLIPRFSLWASLIVGTATIITSFAALYISIISFKRHNEEKQKKLEEDAKLFIHDNNDEIDFLPYCIYASCYDRHGHHSRKIYDNFCRLSDEMQKEVLKQANYSLPLIDNSDWIYDKIDIINRFAEEYGFGDTFLYDNGKNFLNGYLNKDELYSKEDIPELRDVFGMYGLVNRFLFGKGITIDQYFEGYGYRKFRDEKWLKRYEYDPPGDVLIDIKELRDTEKTSNATVAIWMCHEIEDIYYIIEEYFYGKRPTNLIINDAQPEFLEDKFYMTLNKLYCLDDYKKYKLIVKEPFDKKERDEIEKH